MAMHVTMLAFTAMVVFLPCALAYGSGAPASACTSMTPGHLDTNGTALEPQDTNSSPYSVVPSSTDYSSGEVITVTVQGGDYRGVLLQVRKVGDTAPVGTWSSPPAETKLMTCTSADDAVTHSSTTIKGEDAVYTWTAPDDVGNVQFVATVAENHDIYWVGLTSDEVTFNKAVTGATSNTLLLLLAIAFVFLGKYM